MSLKFIDDSNNNKIKDLVVFVPGNRHEPFFMLQRMCKKLDRLIHIDSDDTVVLMTHPITGTEKIKARTLDLLAKVDCHLVKINKNNALKCTYFC